MGRVLRCYKNDDGNIVSYATSEVLLREVLLRIDCKWEKYDREMEISP